MLSACFANSGDNKFSNLIMVNVKSEKAQTKDFKAVNEFIIQDHCFWTRLKISASSLASLFKGILSMMNNTVYLQKQTKTLYKQLFKDSRAESSGWIFLYTDASKISNAVALALVKNNNDMKLKRQGFIMQNFKPQALDRQHHLIGVLYAAYDYRDNFYHLMLIFVDRSSHNMVFMENELKTRKSEHRRLMKMFGTSQCLYWENAAYLVGARYKH
uniref:Uncharacterized protein n=1 Tax=Glossina pallidipes TaxID=7398 RepID=A0A1A9ZMH7_GLOPL